MNMLKIRDVAEYLNELYPEITAEEWDNPGLNVGNSDDSLKGICLALDADEQVIRFASDNDLNLIITHHPLLFNPVKQIRKNTFPGNMIYNLIKNDISLYSLHTNADCADNGVNKVFAEKVKLKNTRVLKENGLGIVGDTEDMELKNFVQYLKSVLNDNNIKFSGSQNKSIKKVALTCGAGCENVLIDSALKAGADVYITSEIKHNYLIDYKIYGMAFIDIGHFTMEYPFMENLKLILSNKFQNLKIKIAGENPFN